MPTRTPAGPARPARKTTAAKPAAKKPGAAKPAAKPAPKRAARHPVQPPAAEAASLRELSARLGKLELAGLAGKLVRGWRDDLATIVEASGRSYAGLQAVVSRRTAQIREATGELQSVAKVMTVIGPKDSVRKLDALARASLELALTNIRELAAMAANSQREAFEIVHGRVTKDIDEVQQLLRKQTRSSQTKEMQ